MNTNTPISKPYVLVNCAVSLDGYLDDASNQRLVLSSPEDIDRVDAVRVTCDAILVGANTIRKDNPSLLIRSEARRQERIKRGLSSDPTKVTLTTSGKFDPSYRFFQDGQSAKLVYCTDEVEGFVRERLAGVAEVIPCGANSINLPHMLADLHRRGVRKLLVEGGSEVITQFLSVNVVDELQISIAPFFVGDARAPRFVNSASFPFNKDRRMTLHSAEKIGDMALLTYFPSSRARTL
ncbi:MAG: dihydrofolate reductase family protein [Ignavibacteriae bacterium]|nr:dihydrofolate reductase family protein [Ignavibacteria bacterium]MBI3365730.1 dihydrofolate reductase family protein [Ignavibacteriota bacterium]